MTRPTLYLMVGYPGAGKTTIASLIRKITGAEHLWADEERTRKFKHPTYSHEENLNLYGQLNNEVAVLLKEGKSVVFDTNFNFKKDRDHLRKIAADNEADCKLIWVNTPRVIAKTRATEDSHEQPTRLLGDIPEADFERISDNMEPPEDYEKPITIVGIDADEELVRDKLQ